MASNPRIDDLRKRLERDPGSRLFAQLAEELRKAGDLDEAIVLSREGLQKHPAYPSARMTLGRALFDKGDLAGARGELEAVLKGAADNILASRLLAECLEGLGDVPAALERYRVTLAMAPGDRQIASRVSALEAKLESAARAARHVAEPAPQPRPADAPIPLVDADEPFELERPYEVGATPAGAGEPASVGPVRPELAAELGAQPAPEPEAEPEVLPAYPPEPEVEPARGQTLPSSSPVPAAASPVPEGAPPGELFEFEAPDDVSEAATLQSVAPLFEQPPALVAPPLPHPLPLPAPVSDFVPEPPRRLPRMEAEPPPPWVAPAAPETPAPEIISSTLAELYFNQGFTEKAIEVYQQVLGREPANERARGRLSELRQLEMHLRAEAAAAASGASEIPTAGRAARRQALERVISRLEGLRATLRRG